MKVNTGIPLDDWRSVPAAAKRAEALGFDGIMTAEIAHDPFAPLVLAATATERIELGTGIVVAFPRSPMVVANTAWDLQAESRGRFSLGLGSQVKGHNQRRFSLPWSPPVPRLQEYIESLRAIWRCWQDNEKLEYLGEHYRFTLMTPEFSPKPSGQKPTPISIAAVGPAMMRLAGRVCDGVKLHGFATRPYLEKVSLPEIDKGLASSGRKRENFEIWGGGFIATGPDDEAVAKEMEWVRYRVAFYGSTRSYQGAFEEHGWEDLGQKLHRMSVAGEWDQMAAQVPDDVVREFAACATWDDLPEAIEKRFGGLTDNVSISLPADIDPDLARDLIRKIQNIPSAFVGHRLDWPPAGKKQEKDS